MPIRVNVPRGAAVAAAIINADKNEPEPLNRSNSSKYDLDGSGNIDQQEIDRTSSDQDVALTLQKVRRIIGEGHKLTTLLSHIDKDGDGIVTKSELREASKSLIKVGHDGILSMSQIEAIKTIKQKLQARQKTRVGYFNCFYFIISFCIYLSILFSQTRIAENYSQLRHLTTTVRGDPDGAGIPDSNTFQSSNDFFNWLDESIISDVFQDPPCGDGLCSNKGDDYPSFGRFGCKDDCGAWPNVTRYYLHVGGMFESEKQAEASGFNVCPKGAIDSRGCHFIKFYQPLQVPKGKTETDLREIAATSKGYWEDTYQKEFGCSYHDWSDNNFGGTCPGFGALPICRWYV